jgi:hypothetical protein
MNVTKDTSELLAKAQAIAAKTAGDTSVLIKLDLLQGLIAELEGLLDSHPLKAVADKAKARTPSMDDKATPSPPKRTNAEYEADKAKGVL